MTAEALKPCPFCGSLEIVFEIYQPGITNVYAIHCLGCNFQTKYYGDPYPGYRASEHNQQLAIAAWNRRTEPIGNSEELIPEWLRKYIEERRNWFVEDRVMKAPEHQLEIYRDVCWIDALEWVLSLKKEQNHGRRWL